MQEHLRPRDARESGAERQQPTSRFSIKRNLLMTKGLGPRSIKEICNYLGVSPNTLLIELPPVKADRLAQLVVNIKKFTTPSDLRQADGLYGSSALPASRGETRQDARSRTARVRIIVGTSLDAHVKDIIKRHVEIGCLRGIRRRRAS